MEAIKSDLIFPLQETPASEKLQKTFAQILHILDNNDMAKALHFCGLFDHTCCMQFVNLFTAHKMGSLILKYILLLDQERFENVCNRIADDNQVSAISLLYHSIKSYSLSPDGSLYFTGGKMDCKDYDTYIAHGDHSLISLQFFNLVEHLHTMIDDPRLFLKHCQKVMASKTCSIPYFSEDDLKGFFYNSQNFKKNSKVMFQAWNCFWTWSDHSMLKELLNLGGNTAELKMLDAFDQYLDKLKSKPISSFNFTLPSDKMIPSATNMHTILAIKYNKLFEECTLQNIFELRHSLIRNCEITSHALQLLSVTSDNSECTLVFWMIPKCVMSLMNAHISDYRSSFNQEIAEISIYPSSLFTINRAIEVGPLAVLTLSSGCIKALQMKNITRPVCTDSVQKNSSSQGYSMMDEGFDVKPTLCQQEERDQVRGENNSTTETKSRLVEVNQQLKQELDGKDMLIQEQNETILRLQNEMKMMRSSHELTEISLEEQLSSIKSELKMANSANQKLKQDNRSLISAMSGRKVDADNNRNKNHQQKTRCEKCQEEDTLKEKLQSLRELMEKIEIESMDRATIITNQQAKITNQQAKIKFIQDNMWIFKNFSRKAVSHAKVTKTLAKKYSRKSTTSHSIKSFHATKSALHAKITLHYAKTCKTLAGKAIAFLIDNPAQVSANGQQEGQDQQSNGSSSDTNRSSRSSNGTSTQTISSHDPVDVKERQEEIYQQPSS